MMTQVASETLGIPVESITARLGDSDLPKAPVEGGSAAAASVGAAVQLACRAVAEKLFKAARKQTARRSARQSSTMSSSSTARSGSSRIRRAPFRYGEVMRAAGEQSIEAKATREAGRRKQEGPQHHIAVFAEVRVDEELGVVRVTRLVCAVAAGRIINPQTARSQIIGGAMMGIGMALHEESAMDHRLGRCMTHNLADYHIPVHADVPELT